MRAFPSARILLLLLLPVAATVAQKPQSFSRNFDQEKVGTVPQGFVAEAGDWKVAAHASAPSPGQALAQWARSDRAVFNVVLASDTSYRDLDLTVSMLALDGQIDQGGGLVWRARDARNYYITRYNPLENNFRVYKVADGTRTQLGSANITKSAGWHILRVVMKGDHIVCYYDGTRHLEVHDATFPGTGKIGLWTKADAQTLFDNLVATSLH